MSKNDGYLMIDLVFSLTISMMLFYSVLSIYESYYKNKTNYAIQIEANDILRGVSLEVKNNVSFEFFNSLQKGKKYFLDINNIKDLIINDFEKLMNFEEKNTKKLWSINVLEVEKDKKLNVEINYRDLNVKNNLSLEEVVTKSIYVE